MFKKTFLPILFVLFFSFHGVASADGVVVALIDTGIELEHPALEASIIDYTSTIKDDGIDTSGHGTMTAGLVLQANPDAKILSIQVHTSPKRRHLDWLTDGIYYASNYEGVKVININFALANDADAVYEAIKYAYEKDIVIVAAMGNLGRKVETYPASYSCVIGVGSVDGNGIKADSSVWGIGVDVMAQGRGIISTDLLGENGYSPLDYASGSGTSFASPTVSGLASLLFHKYPHLSAYDVSLIIKASTASTEGNEEYGYGIVDIDEAIKIGKEWVPITNNDSNCYRSQQFTRSFAIGEPYQMSEILYNDQVYTHSFSNRYGVYAVQENTNNNAEDLQVDVRYQLTYSHPLEMLYIPYVSSN